MATPTSPLLGERLVPRRRAAAAGVRYAESDDSDDGRHSEGSPFKPPTRAKAPAATKGKARAARPAAARASRPPKRRKVAAPVSDAPAADAIELSSDSDASSALSAPPTSPLRAPPPALAPAHARTGSADGTRLFAPARPALRAQNVPGVAGRFGSGLVRSLISITSEDAGSSTLAEDEPAGSGAALKQLGAHVWVRLARDGSPAAAGPDGAIGMWWPALVTDVSAGVRVRLYGHPSPTTATVLGPFGATSVRPLRDLFDGLAFSEDTFDAPLTDASAPSKARKKADAALRKRWRAAVDEARVAEGRTDDEDADEDADSALSSAPDAPPTEPPSSQPPPKRQRGKAKTKPKPARAALPAPPAPADTDHMLMEIPGELVFARSKRVDDYWAARVQAYVPPTEPGQAGRYHLMYCDNVELNVPRAWFFWEEDAAFATCKLGTLDTDQALADDGESDVDTADEDVTDDAPLVLLPATLPPPDPFHGAPAGVQFAYLTPVLSALVSGTYPAPSLHTDFFGGDAARRALTRRKHLRGELFEHEKRALERAVYAWLFGSARGPRGAARRALDDGEVESVVDSVASDVVMASEAGQHEASTSAMSTGLPEPAADPAADPADADTSLPTGPEYASLSTLDKISYCDTVLIPEATFQLLLWHKHERAQPAVQGAAEEARLRARGLELSEQTDWVAELMRRRKRAVRALAHAARGVATRPAKAVKAAPAKPKAVVKGGGTRSRPVR